MESYLAKYKLANIKNIVSVLVYVIVFLMDADWLFCNLKMKKKRNIEKILKTNWNKVVFLNF